MIFCTIINLKRISIFCLFYFALHHTAALLIWSSVCWLFYVPHFLDVWNIRDRAFSYYTKQYRHKIRKLNETYLKGSWSLIGILSSHSEERRNHVENAQCEGRVRLEPRVYTWTRNQGGYTRLTGWVHDSFVPRYDSIEFQSNFNFP